MLRRHDMPFGAMPTDSGTAFRLWAPAAKSVDVRIQGGDQVAMLRGGQGRFSAVLPGNLSGRRYTYLIDGRGEVPDPASRFQPEGPMKPSEIVDPWAFTWTDADWPGRRWEEAVLYELHIGAFTTEGTFRGAIAKLDHLAELGVTALEIMPVAEFAGSRGWGYDGVDLFAIESAYGRPEDLKALIDAAHARELMVIQDVVWNYFGPEGNLLGRYAPQFYTRHHKTPWGDAINFDDDGSEVVRAFYRHHALYWLKEFNVDGLRLDAVHAIKDDSRPSIFEEIANAVRGAAGDRYFHLVAENELNGARLLARDGRGRPTVFTAQWNDDVHHPLHVITTGECGGYYADYADKPIERLGRALAEGFAYQGEPSKLRRGAARGEPSADLPPPAFVPFLQNHDQIGNRPFGDRVVISADPAALRAAVAILILSPQIPLLFMGEEWGSRRPFPYFCDLSPELGRLIRKSRIEEYKVHAVVSDRRAVGSLPDPGKEETFLSAKLDWGSLGRADHAAWLDYYKQLLAIRRREILPLLARFGVHAGHFAVRDGTVLQVDWRTQDGALLALTANLGAEGQPADGLPSGRRIYASHPDRGANLLPWSVDFVSR